MTNFLPDTQLNALFHETLSNLNTSPKTLLVVLRGLPASGKTTFAKRLVALQGASVAVSRDELRDLMFGTRIGLQSADENLVTIQEDSIIRLALQTGQHVIVHDLNLRPRYVKRFYQIAAETGAEVLTVEMPVDVEISVTRDRTRENSVGEKVIREMAGKFLRGGNYLPVEFTEPVKPVRIPYVPNTSLPDAAIFDLDGTVAEANNRGWYDHHLVGNDHVRENIMDLAVMLHELGVTIIFVSGRSDICKDTTWRWIKAKAPSIAKAPRIWLDHSTELHMRKDGDSRQDAQVKYEIFNEHIRNRFNVRWVFDDRTSVVRMWRDDLGLDTLQVNWGDF